jgi:hypothetical protein
MKGVKDTKTQYKVKGIKGTFDALYNMFGLVDRKTALRRVNQNGWTLEDALTKPSRTPDAPISICRACDHAIYNGTKNCPHCEALTPYGQRLVFERTGEYVPYA